MPKKRKPSYLLHKPTGQARVCIDGKDHYLGDYDSPESRERYDALIAEWYARQGDVTGLTLTVDDLSLLYMKHAGGYYVKNGKPSCFTKGTQLTTSLQISGAVRAGTAMRNCWRDFATWPLTCRL